MWGDPQASTAPSWGQARGRGEMDSISESPSLVSPGGSEGGGVQGDPSETSLTQTSTCRLPILTLAETEGHHVVPSHFYGSFCKAGVTALSPVLRVLRLHINPPTESTVWAKQRLSWGERRIRASEGSGEQERSSKGEKAGRGLWGLCSGPGLHPSTSHSCKMGLDFCANQSCPPVGKEPGGDDEGQGVW